MIVDERPFLDVISGARAGLGPNLERAVLSSLTPWYRLAVSARNRLYDCGACRAHSVACPVVSVGNITTGGTGKTPMVAWLAAWFSRQGVQPCLVSRGYRGLDEEGNDELRVLQQLCPGVPHLQGRDRVAAASRTIQQHHPDVIILDDGFQHRRLARDLDIVLIDALNPWGYGRLLPRGLLREPRSALARAGVVVITRADQVAGAVLVRLREEIAACTRAPLVDVAFQLRGLVGIDGQTAPLTALADTKPLAFCGIGNPQGFRRTLRDAGLADESMVEFPDHHHYRAVDLQRLTDRARRQSAQALVTTQKDLVKLDPDWLEEIPVWAISIGATVIAGENELTRVLSRVFPETAGVGPE